MDETLIKAGLTGKGKMHQGYFWPVLGDRQEICFPYENRRSQPTSRIWHLAFDFPVPSAFGICRIPRKK
jgi:hypothetical protein